MNNLETFMMEPDSPTTLPMRWVDGKNPANHLRLGGEYPIIYKVSYKSGGLPDFFLQQYQPVN